jgi:LPS sulfotransferase NodH
MGLESVFPDYKAWAEKGFEGLICPKPTVMIAFSPRTGSTHFCEALHQAGQSRKPTEIFNPRGPAAEERDLRGVASFAAYFESFAADPDEVFIFKTCWLDAAPFAPALTRMFPSLRVVYFSRRNDAAQAVSAFKAELTGTWHLHQGDKEARQVRESQFSMERLLALHASQMRERQGWAQWFAAQGITPLALRYEEFERDINAGLRKFVQGLGLGLGLRTEVPADVGMKKLADQISREWTQRLQRRLLNLG